MAATVDQKLLRATKFPPEFNQKVDMNKVNLEVIKGCALLSVSLLHMANYYRKMDHEQNLKNPWDGG